MLHVRCDHEEGPHNWRPFQHRLSRAFVDTIVTQETHDGTARSDFINSKRFEVRIKKEGCMRSYLALLVLLMVSAFQFMHPAMAQQIAPDIILVGGKIITVDPQNSVVQAIAIHNARVVATGTNAG